MATAAHMFEGHHEGIEAIDVKADQDLGDVNAVAKAAIARLDDGSGVLVLTDVMGGTPSNCCHRLAVHGRVEVIAGVSLPMLLRAITYRDTNLDTVIEKVLAGGKTGAVWIEHC